MIDNNPLVTIAIPTYNGAKYLSDCLESAIAQSYPHTEILIIDDQSQDDTVAIARHYAAQDHRIKLIINPQNLGLVGNWNNCLKLAKGDWIKFLFQDDLLDPNCLSLMLSHCHPQTYFIGCDRRFIFAENISSSDQNYYTNLPNLATFFPHQTEITPQDYCQFILNHLHKIYLNPIGEPTSVMIHRHILNQVGYFNPYLIQLCDLEFWMRIILTQGMTYLPQTLAMFRVHSAATTRHNQEQKSYRKNILDQLLIVYELVYHPLYQPLRNLATQQNPSLNLTTFLRNQAYNAKRIAQRSQTESWRQDWHNLLRFYPQLESLSHRSLSKQILTHLTYRWQKMQSQKKQNT